MQPVNVLFVQRQPCIRSLKYAQGLRAIGAELHLAFACEGATLTEFYGHGDELFDEWFRIGSDARDALREIAQTSSIDLVHCHNGPDTLTTVCLDLFGGRIPIVHDVHDLMSARQTDYDDALDHGTRHGLGNSGLPGDFAPPPAWLEEERRAMEESDAVIAVSTEIFDLARRREYAMPAERLTYANYVPEQFIPAMLSAASGPSASGPLRVVYEGTLNDDGGHYDLREIFARLASQGLEVHIYPSREEPGYAALADEVAGIVYHERLAPRDLMKELPRYDVGWAGFNDGLNATHLETVLPNKLFEYVASGLPVVSFPHRALARFIAQHGVGLVVEDLDRLEQRLRGPELAAARARAIEIRRDVTVEANIGRVLSIYDRLMSRPHVRGGKPFSTGAPGPSSGDGHDPIIVSTEDSAAT